jgi:hypothetical protein
VYIKKFDQLLANSPIHRMLDALLRDLLVSEIVDALHSEFPDQPLERIVREKIQRDPPTFQRLRDKKSISCKVSDADRCCARIWDSHRGGRCASKKANTDYCHKHQNILERDGTLMFGRYDKPKPLYNELGNRLPWFEGDPFHEIGSLFTYQRHSLRSLIKEREVTP